MLMVISVQHCPMFCSLTRFKNLKARFTRHHLVDVKREAGDTDADTDFNPRVSETPGLSSFPLLLGASGRRTCSEDIFRYRESFDKNTMTGIFFPAGWSRG